LCGFNFNFKVAGVGPHRLGGQLIAAAPQDPPGSFTARFAGTTDMF